MNNNRKTIQKIFEFLVGIFSLVISSVFCFTVFGCILNKLMNYAQEQWSAYFILLAFSFILTFFCFSSPINLLKRNRIMEFWSTLRNCAITYSIFAISLLLTKNEIIESRYMFIGGFVGFCILSLAGRFILKKIMIYKMSTNRMATMTGIITTTDRAENFVKELKMDWTKNVKAIALIDTEFDGTSYGIYSSDDKSSADFKRIDNVDMVPVVANLENVMGWIRTASLDEVFINLPEGHMDEVTHLIEKLEDMGITVNVNIPSLERIVKNSKFDNIDCLIKADYPMAVFSPIIHNNGYLVIKRIMDIIGGLVGTIISLPIILITAIPLLIESPGPLIFKQQRVGKNGRIFNIYKLRSMYPDAEERKQALMAQNKMDGLMFKMDNDPRITKVGKFIRKTSIDELPQFWNVLKGDMSLVGTRPPTLDEFEQYESHHKRRLSLKPGITGMWQVSGRSDIQDFEEVVALDCEYIDNWSIGMDIKILFKTVGVVLTHKGAE